MTIPLSYFAIGSALSNLVNVETIVPTTPHILPDYGGRPMATQGMTLQRAANGYGRRNGALTGAWRFNVMADYAKYRTLKAYLNRAAAMYIITLDEDNHWSPYLCYLDAPFMGDSVNTKNGIPFDITVNQFGGVLQYDVYSANHTVTVDEHLILCYSQTAAFTLTLPAISSAPTYVPYRLVNGGAYTVTIDGDGSETIDGNATKTLTGTNLLTDGNMEAADTSAWTAITATLSKQTGTPHGGSRVLRITRDGSDVFRAGQDVLVDGIYYTVRGYARSDGNATPYLSFTGTTLWTGTTSTSWQEFNVDFTATSEPTLKLAGIGVSAGWYVEFDDVFLVYNLPEPYGYQASTQCTLISNGTQWVTIADA